MLARPSPPNQAVHGVMFSAITSTTFVSECVSMDFPNSRQGLLDCSKRIGFIIVY